MWNVTKNPEAVKAAKTMNNLIDRHRMSFTNVRTSSRGSFDTHANCLAILPNAMTTTWFGIKLTINLGANTHPAKLNTSNAN
jgi:hypothetical protein